MHLRHLRANYTTIHVTYCSNALENHDIFVISPVMSQQLHSGRTKALQMQQVCLHLMKRKRAEEEMPSVIQVTFQIHI